jgi:beta-lactam-binding protein with PASTA domain
VVVATIANELDMPNVGGKAILEAVRKLEVQGRLRVTVTGQEIDVALSAVANLVISRG